MAFFIYRDHTLLYFPTEEGRIRYVPAHGSTAAGYTYDYFVRDHLGDVRMVLTEQTDFSQYMVTMEPANTEKENALFYNVDQTRMAKPQGYPEDETTTPNTAVARLNAREPDHRIGPSIILKVMAGDTLQAAVRGYYHQQGTAPDQPSIPAEEMVSSLLAALPGLAEPADPGHQASAFTASQDQGPRFTAGDLQQLKEKDPQTLNNQKPRAFLNYVFFDNQLNFVEEGSGVKQVQAEPDELETLSSGEVVAKKSGYVYVYTSNESQQDVLFDNLVVTQSTGPILEETHYYPFGQTMAGISTLAPLRLENRFKYNGKELNHLEFSDGVGLDIYDYGFRNYDPQVGRFIEQDPITDNLATLSLYQYAANDPIANIDVDGLVPFGIPCPGTSSMAIFFEKVGAGISQFANSPLARALSISVHTLQDAGMVQNAISTSNMINNAFTAVGVGIASQAGNLSDSGPEDWYRDKNGIMQFDPNVNSQKDLSNGETYVGETYRQKTSKGGVEYRRDGSIYYTDETQAYNRIWNNANSLKKEELGIIMNKGVLITPSYKNELLKSSPDVYGYIFMNGKIFDPLRECFKKCVSRKLSNFKLTIWTIKHLTSSHLKSRRHPVLKRERLFLVRMGC